MVVVPVATDQFVRNRSQNTEKILQVENHGHVFFDDTKCLLVKDLDGTCMLWVRRLK